VTKEGGKNAARSGGRPRERRLLGMESSDSKA
jgi:hypothetical protein